MDAEGRTAPDRQGVLSHYQAVVWYTGDDLYVREPSQPGGTGVSRLLNDEVIGVRDFLNDGGKLLTSGKHVLQGSRDDFLFNPLGAPPAPFCASNQTQGNGDADDPEGQVENCVPVSNDFIQYYLGGYHPDRPRGTMRRPRRRRCPSSAVAGGPFGSLGFTLNGPD